MEQNGRETSHSALADDWHELGEEQIFARLGTSEVGLGADEVSERLTRFGPNALPARKPPGLPLIFLHQFLSPLIYILLVAGAVSLAIGETTDAIFIFAVILLNATLGTFQEWKAERSAAALQNLLKISARVHRGGEDELVAAETLVPGDIVLLDSGSRVPADLRLLSAKNLAVDESLLTGESVAVEKHTGILSSDLPISERCNMAFAGASVTSGRGRGVVVATGMQTQVGRIARAVTTAEAAKPPLIIRMEHFARQISYLVLGFIALLAVVAILEGMPATEVFFMAVALAVSAIPEGLPVAMTVALSIATSRMAKRNVIVRKLTAVEGLGSCTCIASDKTGTLTVNRQTVRRIWLPSGEEFHVTGEGYAGEGHIEGTGSIPLDDRQSGRLRELIEAGVHCNEATLARRGDEWVSSGDAMDIALLALGWKIGHDPQRLREQVEVLGEIPYESELRYAARFYWDEKGTWVVKGAVERVLSFCVAERSADGGETPLDSLCIEQEALRLAGGGYRVLAVASGHGERSDGDGFAGERDIPPLTLLGLVGFIDPLRPEVGEAVTTCRIAGVKVVMVTGDHPATALAIARELGIAEHPEQMITGEDIGEEPEEDHRLQAMVGQAKVFARVSPLQKLRIVAALNLQGHFTAVTGDGVNDAPALRRAHIGVAMGSGTDVAKDTAAIIVTDDNFASIVAGVEEGRFAYDNIRKVVYLLISTGGAELVLFSLALLFALPLPLMAVQLLWLNLVTNGIQDVALAFEGGEPGVMAHPPRRPSEAIFNPLMIQQCAVSGVVMGLTAFAVWWWTLSAGWDIGEARNTVLLMMVLLENVHVFNCRSERTSAFKVPLARNRILVFGVLAAQGIHILVMHIPLMQEVLGVMPVVFGEWFILLLLALILLASMEFFKRMKASVRERRR